MLSRRTAVSALALPLAGCLKSDLPELGDVPPFQLVAQDGRVFDSKTELEGKIWTAAFIFTTCNGPCPRMSAQLKRVQEQTADLGDTFRLVSFTIDPLNDTPEKLLEYSRRFKAEPRRCFFLTGEAAAIRYLGVDVFHLADPQEKLAHSTRFALVDRKSRIRGYYDTSHSNAISDIVADIRKLKREIL